MGLFDFIKNLFPYRTKGKNNKIYIVLKNKKKVLKRKLSGLDINISGDNNTIILHYPIYFKNSLIQMEGNDSSFEMLASHSPMCNTKIYLKNNDHIYIGAFSKFNTGNIKIMVNNNPKDKPSYLKIGNSIQVGENVRIRTSDGHAIFNQGEKLPYNAPEDVIIGDNVWLGLSSTILKGSHIPSNTIVAAHSLVNKKFEESGTILAGLPAKVIKRNIRWDSCGYGFLVENSGHKYKSDKCTIIKKYLHRKFIELKCKFFF